MGESLKSITVAALLIGSLWSVPRIHVVHLAKMCSGPTVWRVTVHPTDAASFGLASGVYQVSSYSLTNGFGLISVGRSAIGVFNNPNLPLPVSRGVTP